jgi:hypothetical protein
MKRYIYLAIAIFVSFSSIPVQADFKAKVKPTLQCLGYSAVALGSAIIGYDAVKDLSSREKILSSLFVAFKKFDTENKEKSFKMNARTIRADVVITTLCAYTTYKCSKEAVKKFKEARKA